MSSRLEHFRRKFNPRRTIKSNNNRRRKTSRREARRRQRRKKPLRARKKKKRSDILKMNIHKDHKARNQPTRAQ